MASTLRLDWIGFAFIIIRSTMHAHIGCFSVSLVSDMHTDEVGCIVLPHSAAARLNSVTSAKYLRSAVASSEKLASIPNFIKNNKKWQQAGIQYAIQHNPNEASLKNSKTIGALFKFSSFGHSSHNSLVLLDFSYKVNGDQTLQLYICNVDLGAIYACRTSPSSSWWVSWANSSCLTLLPITQ